MRQPSFWPALLQAVRYFNKVMPLWSASHFIAGYDDLVIVMTSVPARQCLQSCAFILATVLCAQASANFWLIPSSLLQPDTDTNKIGRHTAWTSFH